MIFIARGRIASKTQAKLGAIIYGEQFTGKSTMAMQLAMFKRPDGKPFKLLYIDAESGSIDDYLGELEANGVNLNNIYIVYTQSLAEVRQYIAKVKNNEDIYELDEEGDETDTVVLDSDGEPFRADAIVVDGSTVLNLTTKQGLVEFSKKRNKVKADKAGLIGDERTVKIEGAGIEIKDYQTINFKGQDLILDLAASGVHYVVTARETDEKQYVLDENGKQVAVPTGRKIPDGFKDMTYNVRTEIRMFRNEDGTVCAHIKKDRSHTHPDNSIIEDPTLLDWQSIIDKTAKNKEFVLKNDLTKSTEVEQKLYEREILGKVGDPVDSSEISATATPTSNETEIKNLRAKIVELRNSLPPAKKSSAKTVLQEKGLPIKYADVTDPAILKEVIEVISNL